MNQLCVAIYVQIEKTLQELTNVAALSNYRLKIRKFPETGAIPETGAVTLSCNFFFNNRSSKPF